MKNAFLLSACLSVITMNHVMAMEINEPAPEPTPLAPLMTERQHQDPFIVMLSQLDLESVVNTLMTNKATASNTELWKFLAEFHGVSASEGQSDQDAMLRTAMTLRDIKQKMMSETLTCVSLKHFSKEATKKPYLWSTLLESLPQIYKDMTVKEAQVPTELRASSGHGIFAGIPDAEYRAYLEKIVTRGTFGAQQAQEFLNTDAYSGKGLFGGIPAAERRIYLESVVKRGTFGAEHAQGMLKKFQTNN